MNVQNGGIATTNDILRLDNTQIRPESRDRLDRVFGGSEDKAGLNVFVRDSSETETDIVSAEGVVHLFGFFGEDSCDFDCGLEGIASARTQEGK